MVYTGTIVTSAEMVFMAGENVDATGSVEANWNYLAYYAEAYLSALVKYDIVTNWATMTANYKRLFTEYAARYAAIQLIAYNMTGYTLSRMAENLVNIHWARLQEIKSLLDNSDIQDFMAV